MQNENEKDVYYDLYKASKITIAELREFEVYKDWSDEQLQVLSDQLFDIAIVAQKIMVEENDWFKRISKVWEKERGSKG